MTKMNSRIVCIIGNSIAYYHEELCCIMKLQYLDLSYCSMVDTFPSELNWNSSQLTYLNLLYNRLTGSIPPQLGQLPNRCTEVVCIGDVVLVRNTGL